MTGAASPPRTPAAQPPSVVVLVGFMGAGKSAVGRCLAERLGWRFIDLDGEIVRRTGASVAELFRRYGEAGFRTIEADTTAALGALRRAVLATGGGWWLDPAARTRVGAPAFVVWLRVSLEEALRRVGADTQARPLLAGADPPAAASALWTERQAEYARADVAVDVDGRTPDAIAQEIAALIGRH